MVLILLLLLAAYAGQSGGYDPTGRTHCTRGGWADYPCSTRYRYICGAPTLVPLPPLHLLAAGTPAAAALILLLMLMLPPMLLPMLLSLAEKWWNDAFSSEAFTAAGGHH